MKPRKLNPGELPTREQILAFIKSSDAPAGKREIAKAFGIRGSDKIALKALLKDMGDEGLIDAGPGRAFHQLGGVPKVTVLRVVHIDDAGRAVAVPERWEAEGDPPRLRVMEKRGKGGQALAVGDRILARNEEQDGGWVAHPMKKLLKGSELVLGVVHGESDKHFLRPVDKRERRELMISDLGDAQIGDLVLAEKTGRPPRITARVDSVLGDPFQPRSFSLIAIHKFGIPDRFSDEVIRESEKVAKLPLEGKEKREDLRHIPILAIDPVDARDHDDAVWAAPDDDPANPEGFKAIVAIADVGFYVRPGSALDREARKRGNSVYFPDRVVPMLPEVLSADVCSLKEGEDRAALVCHLQVTKDGQLKSWRFTRAAIRVRANLAYEDAQAAIDALSAPLPLAGGAGGGKDSPRAAGGEVSPPLDPLPQAGGEDLVRDVLVPLWACWRALYKAREKRAPLDLDLPERRVVLDETGRIMSVAPRERLDAHKLIEDYMIAANVAAAKAIEAKTLPVMYRIHEPPSREKLVALKDYLATFDIELALGQVIRPATFNRLIERLGDHENRPQVMEQILRTQTQAYYGPDNHGHFGLALGSYAHFTSPIRRYSDLIVHRALVRAYRLDPDAQATQITEDDVENMSATAELISQHERRAMEAERETLDRYVAAYLSEHVGQVVEARITGVQPFGFFATVVGLGGDGLVPVSTLGDDYYRYDEKTQSLVGDDKGETFKPGQLLKLRLAEADPVAASLRFELPDRPSMGRARPVRDGRRGEGRGGPRRDGAGHMVGKRGRPGNIRHKGRKR